MRFLYFVFSLLNEFSIHKDQSKTPDITNFFIIILKLMIIRVKAISPLLFLKNRICLNSPFRTKKTSFFHLSGLVHLDRNMFFCPLVNPH